MGPMMLQAIIRHDHSGRDMRTSTDSTYQERGVDCTAKAGMAEERRGEERREKKRGVNQTQTVTYRLVALHLRGM